MHGAPCARGPAPPRATVPGPVPCSSVAATLPPLFFSSIFAATPLLLRSSRGMIRSSRGGRCSRPTVDTDPSWRRLVPGNATGTDTGGDHPRLHGNWTPVNGIRRKGGGLRFGRPQSASTARPQGRRPAVPAARQGLAAVRRTREHRAPNLAVEWRRFPEGSTPAGQVTDAQEMGRHEEHGLLRRLGRRTGVPVREVAHGASRRRIPADGETRARRPGERAPAV